MAELNVYAPPAAERFPPLPDQDGGPRVSPDGRLVVLARNDARLPPRCVVCDAPAVGEPIQQDFTWHPRWVYLTLIIGIVVYWIAAGMARWSATVEFGLCEEHLKRRTRGRLLSWIGGLGGVVLLAGGMVAEAWGIMLLGVIVGTFLAVAGSVIARTASVAKIDARHVWLRVGAPFLASMREPADDFDRAERELEGETPAPAVRRAARRGRRPG
jgi:hypothetical protein